MKLCYGHWIDPVETVPVGCDVCRLQRERDALVAFVQRNLRQATAGGATFDCAFAIDADALLAELNLNGDKNE